ncbi:MAG: L-histidine N(alpha)-methyltransferase [Acidimicrobiales bacterium]
MREIGDRCTIEVHLSEADLAEALRRDAKTGLTATPKHVPPKWFYDERGSQLFDDITRLPEYYPTRKETEILEREAGSIARRTGATSLVELGSGTSTKTRLLLDGLAEAGTLERFVPFDVCEPVLVDAGPELAAAYPGIRVDAVVGDFEQHLGHLPMEGTTMVAFLGGTIGNLVPAARARFFEELTDQMASGDWLLLGTDLVKDPARLIAAYDDAAGVTAEFNRNVLHVLNRELDGDFSPYRFAHVAKWNKEQQWIEMHLRAEGDQRAVLRAIDLEVAVADGEMIHTEISAKFTRQRVQEELAAAGLELDELLTDRDGDFALALARRG